MDLQKISQRDLNSAITFSEMLKMDLSEAASILASYDWCIERALASIDLKAEPQQQKKSELKINAKAIKQQKPFKSKIQKQQMPQKFQMPYKNPNQERKSNKREEDFYQSQKPHNFSQVQQGKKGRQSKQYNAGVATNQVFLGYITKLYHPRINFAFGSFNQNLQKAFKQRKFVLVYVHCIDEQIEKKYHLEIQQIMKNKDIVHYINNYCIAFGAIHENQDHSPIAKYIQKQKNIPLFILFQFDHIRNKQKFLGFYKLGAQELNFLEWISMMIDTPVAGEILFKVGQRFKQLKENGKKEDEGKYQEEDLQQLINKQQYLDEQFRGKSWASQLKQDQDFPSQIYKSSWKQSYLKSKESKVNPSLIKQKKEDERLIEEQDAAYLKMQKSYMRKKEVSELKHQQSKIKALQKEEKEKQLEKRRKELEHLFPIVKDQNYIDVKFRLPNGKSVVHKFKQNDNVEKLFIYVDIFCRDDFQEKFSNFDLALNYSNLILGDLKSQQLQKVFEGSKAVIIIVKQK